MTNVSRADKKCVREIIFSLESSSKLDAVQISNFKKYLSSLGFSNESEYFSRANSLEEKINERERIKNEEKIISNTPRVTKYSGAYSNEKNYKFPVKLCFRYDHLFLSRNYKNKLQKSPGVKVSWRFEFNGEIYLLDALDISSRNITHILGPLKNSTWPHVWSNELDFLFYEFPNLDPIQKTDLLLKWGYNNARELYCASQKKSLEDSSSLQEEEIGLTKIYSNPLVLNILKNSSRKIPSFLLEGKNGKIDYT